MIPPESRESQEEPHRCHDGGVRARSPATGRHAKQDTRLDRPEQLDSFDCTLANLGEWSSLCLDAAGARSVAEVGAEHGLFTAQLLDWAARAAAPSGSSRSTRRRAPRLRDLAAAKPELELIVGTSHEALAELELPDAVIIDGDHNYFTVSERAAADRRARRRPRAAADPPARHRLAARAPRQLPRSRRGSRPSIASRSPSGAFLRPGRGRASPSAASTTSARPPPRAAPATASSPRVEDFVAERPELRLARSLPPFFGLGVVWHRDRSWADAVEAAVAPWDATRCSSAWRPSASTTWSPSSSTCSGSTRCVSADYDLQLRRDRQAAADPALERLRARRAALARCARGAGRTSRRAALEAAAGRARRRRHRPRPDGRRPGARPGRTERPGTGADRRRRAPTWLATPPERRCRAPAAGLASRQLELLQVRPACRGRRRAGARPPPIISR